MSKVFKWAAGTAVVVAAAFGGWSLMKPEPQSSFITEVVKRGDIRQTVSATGEISPFNLVSVGAEASGQIEKLDAAASDEYFESRPYTSRIGAWASAQSEVISSKAVLVAKAAAVGVKHPLHVPRPPHWGGYLVIPDRIEFWQGRPSRLHDRIQYRLIDGNWIRERLSP